MPTRKQELARAQRRYRLQTTGVKMEIATLNGSLFDSAGRVYVREIGGASDGGETIRKVPMAIDLKSGINAYIGEGRRVIVKVDLEGDLYIEGNDKRDLRNAGINPRQLNANDPSTRYKTLSLISDLQSFPTGGDFTVMVHPGFYRKTNGNTAHYAGQLQIDLEPYKPATSTNQLVACVILNEDTNAVTITTSSELAQSTILRDDITTAMTYVNEAEASAPARAVNIQSYIINGDDTVVSEQSKFINLRPFISAYSRYSSNSNVITNNSTIPSGKDAFFAGSLTIEGGLTVEGELYIL